MKSPHGVARLIIVGLVLAGIGIGLYLTEHPQIFRPKASEYDNIPDRLSAAPNPCFIPAGQTTCESKIIWSTSNQAVKVLVRETGAVLSTAQSGEQAATGMTTTPVHVDLYAGNTLLTTVAVQGTTTQVTSAGQSTQSNPYTLANGLLSYYRLDETSGDVMHDITGLNNGKAINTRPTDGKFGKARNFVADWDYIELGNSAALANGNSITLSAWVNPSQTGWQVILFRSGTWDLSNSIQNQPYLGIWNGSSWVTCRASTQLTPNNWYLLTGSYDRTNIKFYVNGVLENTCPQNTYVNPVSGNAWIGRSTTPGFHPWRGNIDEVGIWNRALTASEVQDLANGALPGISAPTKSATITAIPNPCTITSGETCTSTISWTSQNAPDLKISIKENPGSLFASAPSGSTAAPWIRATGATFEAYSGTELLASLFVQGTTGTVTTPPTGILKASPNPCTITSGETCTSTISWNSNYSDLQISIKEAPGSVFAKGAKGLQAAPWIRAAGATFEAYSGGQLKDSLFVKGVIGEGVHDTGILSASPNPCIITTGETCTSTISWSSSAGNLKISIKEAPGSLFAQGVKGSQAAPWIRAAGATFEAYLGNTLVDSLFVKGISASPNPTASPSPQPSSSAAAVPGDLDHNGSIDALDYNIFLQDYQSSNLRSDLNNDGQVDVLDYTILLSNFSP